ncbi:MAG TPA: cation diffusion facilitator family transporter [Candidatus Limnocylindrales bacterium]|nr:cation diffusion facilitator family transporter [Candidatus Limnocylindrales bacterium]
MTSAAGRSQRALLAALGLTSLVLVVELLAAAASHSLSLLADAGHVAADVSGMSMSALAVWIARRATDRSRSFGLFRLEVLAANLNAVLLLAVSAFVIWQGVLRVLQPEAVDGPVMAVVAAGALIANLLSLRVLHGGQSQSLTLRGAYLELIGDSLGAGAVLVAGVIDAATGFQQADGLAAVLIGFLIVPRALRLLRDTFDVLMEAAPKGIDVDEVTRHILEAPGVDAVHDLHAWTITSGMNVVSAHVVLGPDADPGQLIDHLSDCLAGDFDIAHSTFQLETPEHVIWEGRAQRTTH